MKNYGFVKVGAGLIPVQIANPVANAAEMEKLIFNAAQQGVRLLTFGELSLTGYTCNDLFLQPLLLTQTQEALAGLVRRTSKLDLVFMVGLPVAAGPVLLNAAAVCYRGKILGIVPKTYLPNYREFQEPRWFTSAREWQGTHVEVAGQTVPAGTDLLFEAGECLFGIEICEDLWAVEPPSGKACLQGADLIFNLSASNTLVGKQQYVRQLVAQQSARSICGYIYASGGFGESTTDVVLSGHALVSENGHLLAASADFATGSQLITTEIDLEKIRHERQVNTTFRQAASLLTGIPYYRIESGQKSSAVSKLSRVISPTPFVPSTERLTAACEEIFNIQVLGLATRLTNAHLQAVTVGISGGLDSTLALLVCVKAFDKLGLSRKKITGVTMPGFGTTDRTYQNACKLMKGLGITQREISIKKACEQHFADIGHVPAKQDTTYENAQARERTQILMDVANQTGGIVVGTGDLSELSLGWATYNGDHMSMYGVNADVPKTLVRSLVAWAAQTQTEPKTSRILEDVLATPISPELLPAKQGKIAQKTEDLVGPYELHDFFLYYFLRHGFGPEKIFFLAKHAFKNKFTPTEIKKWLCVFFRRFFTQQFKRSCMPDGPKVGTVGLSPRGDWRMPSDVTWAAWQKSLEKL